MELLVISFLAGVLTAAAPCVLPLLPVIVGGSVVSGNEPSGRGSLRRSVTIVVSLAVSIIVFSLLLKATTALLGVPDAVWAAISGGIVLVLGITLIWPSLWERVMVRTGVSSWSGRLMAKSGAQTGMRRDVLLGAALGPVFNSCSPTYALIVAVILPASFARGLACLVAYAVGLAAVLLLVSVAGRVVIDRLEWLSDPRGRLRRVIGALFVVVGVGVMFGLDRDIQTWVIENGWYAPIEGIEESLDPQP